MKSESDLSFCGPWRHPHGDRHQRRVVGNLRRFEYDHPVLGLDGAIAESLLLQHRPVVDVGHGRNGKYQQSQ